jgi:sec-independent protein translocase protein TatA
MLGNFALLDLGAPELAIIFAIILVLFGGKKLPELSKSLGESISEIKKATAGANDLHNEVKGQVNEVKAAIVGTPTVSTATTESADTKVPAANS